MKKWVGACRGFEKESLWGKHGNLNSGALPENYSFEAHGEIGKL